MIMNESLDTLLARAQDQNLSHQRELKEARKRCRDSIDYRRLVGACGDFTRFEGGNWKELIDNLCKERVSVWIRSLSLVRRIVGVKGVERLKPKATGAKLGQNLYLRLLRAADPSTILDSVASDLASFLECGPRPEITEFFRQLRGLVKREPPARKALQVPPRRAGGRDPDMSMWNEKKKRAFEKCRALPRGEWVTEEQAERWGISRKTLRDWGTKLLRSGSGDCRHSEGQQYQIVSERLLKLLEKWRAR